MPTMKISRAESGLFSDQHIRIVDQNADIQPFVNRLFSKSELLNQINEKKVAYTNQQREVLKEAVLNQYGKLQITDAVQQNIDQLGNENCFTVTTGHQLSLLTGPLYFVIKILHVIKMAEEVNKSESDIHIVPVFWMATEDHDYEEIQSTTIFGKKITHDYEQRGPVGRFDLTNWASFQEVILNLFGEGKQEEVTRMLEAYAGKSLADATRGLVNELFGDKGLIIVDGDDPLLKEQFVPIMQKELTDRKAEKEVKRTDEVLLESGFKPQVFVRPINLFYINKGIRSRIQFENNKYIIDGIGSFDEDELVKMIKESPESYSPNALMRPLYQELILPNILYVGGGGEMAYWLQLKSTFKSYGVVYPMIQVRNSLIWMDKTTRSKLETLNLEWSDIFRKKDELKKEFVTANAADELNFSDLENRFESLKEGLKQTVLTVDAKLENYLSGETKRLEKQLEGIKGKLVKVSKGKFDQAMKSFDLIFDRLFPNGGLQERSLNILSFCGDGQVQRKIDLIYGALDVFSKDLIVLIEE